MQRERLDRQLLHCDGPLRPHSATSIAAANREGKRPNHLRPASAQPSTFALLRRRSSTPNTTQDIIKLFDGKSHPHADPARSGSTGSRIPTASSHGARNELNRPPVARRPSTAGARSFLIRAESADDVEPAHSHIQPQTVAFLDLLAAHRRKSTMGAFTTPKSVALLGGTSSLPGSSFTSKRPRPSTAPFVPGGGDNHGDIKPSIMIPWEPMLLTSEQQARVVQRHRPLSAQARAKALEEVVAPRRPNSALKNRVSEPSSSTTIVTPRCHHMLLRPASATTAGVQTAPVDFFAHVSLRQCPFVDNMFDNPDVLHDVVSLLEVVCSACVHRDATKYSLTSPFVAPLPWLSPWSQVTAQCRIVREALQLQIASPSSKLIGSRVFDDIVTVLNTLSRGEIAEDLCRDFLLSDLAHHRVILNATVALPDEEDHVLLHEAPRHIDDDPLVMPPAPEPAAPRTTSPIAEELHVDVEVDDIKSSRMSLPLYGIYGSAHNTSPTAQSDRTGAAAAVSPSHSRDTSQAVSPTGAHSRFNAAGFSVATLDEIPSCVELPHSMSAKQHNGMLPWKLRSFRSLRRQRASATNQQSDTPLDAPFTTINDEDDVSHRGPSEGEEENSPAPRRVSSISMFKRGSEFGEATAMLRRLSVARLDSQSENLSRESSPSIVPPRTRSMVRFEAVASVQRRQSQLIRTLSSQRQSSESHSVRSSSNNGNRPHVAIIIVVSTFRDASIPNCRGVWEDAQQIAKLLREDCAFDYVSLLTSESPETPDHTTTMTGVRREIQRVIQRFLVDDRNPSIVVIALGRGGVVPVGSVSGVGTHSTALVPYPSVAYAAATHAPRAKQPSPAVKVALLETAVVANGLQSTDVITPEMFQEIFQWNGKICKPAAVFFDMQETPGLPAKYGRDFSASSSSQPVAEACCVSTGFCSWTVPEYPAASFVSVYKAGQRAIGSFYLLKLLRGGILQSAIKEFGNPAALYATRASLDREGAPSPSFLSSMSPIPLPHYITRHIQSRLAIYPSDVHYYLVKKLMGRNCNTLFLLDLHVRGMDAGEDNGEGSPTFATAVKNRKNRISSRPAFSEPLLFQLPSSDVVSPPSGGSPLEVLAKLSMANSALISATHVPSDTVTMQLVVPMPLWRRNDDNMLTTASTDGHGRRPNPVLFEQQAARFRVSLHSALMKVFKGKNSIVASLMQQSWVTDVSVDHEALAFTLALQSGLTTSAVVDDCATTVQTACNTSTSSEEGNPSFDPFEVEVNAATCVIVATAHRNAIRGRSGASSPPSVTNVDRIANRILHDAMTAGVPCKELTVSVIVQLALPSRDLYRKVDKVLRLGVLRQALSNESYVLVQPCPL